MNRHVFQSSNLKNVNRVAVLNYIRHYGKSTRVNLSNVTGLTFTSIKNILGELEDLGLVEQSDELEGTIGRKAVNYVIKKDFAYTIGVHINMYYTRIALMNIGGQILKIEKISMNREDIPTEEFVNEICTTIKKLIEETTPRREILGVGVGTPGPINVKDGIVLNPPNLRVFRYFPLGKVLEAKLNLPVLVHKDTNAIAMGEYYKGAAAEDYKEMIYIDADIGIGSGMIVNGQVKTGTHSAAGEFGHVTINTGGPRCNCGRSGCLEAISSGLSIVRQVEETMHEQRFKLPIQTDVHLVDRLNQIFSAAAEGDAALIQILNSAALNMGEALGSVINFYDPELIVLGGMLCYEYPSFFSVVKQAATEKCINNQQEVRIVPGKLGYMGGVIGAGEIVAERFFSSGINNLLQN